VKFDYVARMRRLIVTSALTKFRCVPWPRLAVSALLGDPNSSSRVASRAIGLRQLFRGPPAGKWILELRLRDGLALAMKVRQQRLGHSDSRPTMDAYTHIASGDDQQIAEQLGEILVTSWSKTELDGKKKGVLVSKPS